MEISSLASGSSGNCFYIENDGKAVLIDAGISTKQIVERLSLIKKNPEKIKGIFITHEHSDHIRGAALFSRKFNVPIFATRKTVKNCYLNHDKERITFIRNYGTVDLCGMQIEAFSKPHNAEDPVSYSLTNGKKISVITDVGFASKNVTENVSDSDFLCLESNHDIEMLEKGPYPYFLKRWIKSNQGHLSNMQAALCVLEHAPSRLKHVMLSHLSQTNNDPEIALETFKILKERKDLNARISVSSREKPTQLFKLN